MPPPRRLRDRDAKASGAGDLPARYVIHTVGPVWRGGTSGEPDQLAECDRRSLEVAASLGCRTVAFPAISTGTYGYPLAAAAHIAIQTVSAIEAPPVELVRFVLFTDESLVAVQAALAPSEPSGVRVRARSHSPAQQTL